MSCFVRIYRLLARRHRAVVVAATACLIAAPSAAAAAPGVTPQAAGRLPAGPGGSTPQQGYVVHWTGARWIVAAGLGTVPAYSKLYGISAAGPADVWAVGLTQQPGPTQPPGLTVHWDGTTWSQVPAGPPGGPVSLHAVLAGAPQEAWSVGAGTSPQPPFGGPVSFRHSGGAWHAVKVPVAFGSLGGLAADGGRLWAAGMRLDRQGTDVPLVITRGS